ncbi:unnamed protein product [Heligmosomoides polygyrus]|uniref:Receptor expression-enhancing protein n=1 Tax=Heligmosomoides polygyrus TaxID=6339 RepID=A0A183GGH7_HELPZ|nr:unnamed protein product [Heligmosomoides polygyrus]
MICSCRILEANEYEGVMVKGPQRELITAARYWCRGLGGAADLVAWCHKSHGAALDEQLKKVDAAGVKREHIAYGVIGLTCLYLMAGEEAMFVSYLITFFYPANVSIEAIRGKNSGEAMNVLQYWIPFGFLALIDSTSVSYFPAYYFIKTAFLVFLFLPQTQGSSMLYQKVIDPVSKAVDGLTKKK